MMFPQNGENRMLRAIAVSIVIPALTACAPDTSSPRVFDVESRRALTAKAAQGPSVSSANPSYGDQGTTVDVQIVGSGFSSGAAATWLLNGVADNHVHTNSTRFVSSTQLVANITIASDAAIAFWDVQVSLVGGKNGVGSDAFEVTSALVLSPNNVTAVLAGNDLQEVVGYWPDAFVIDDQTRFVDLGAGQAWALDPLGSTALGRNGNGFATAWSRQANGSWTATTLPPTPNGVESNAAAAARAPDGSLLVGGWDGVASAKKGGGTLNRPIVWEQVGSTWMPPIIYAIPAGASTASAQAINASGQIAGRVDGSTTTAGAVWDSPTSVTRLDGVPEAINSAGTLLVGRKTFGGVIVAAYWARDPATHAWQTIGVPLPSIAGAGCTYGDARGLNDDGVIVGDSCGMLGKRQATVWLVDLTSGSPVLVGSPSGLPGLGPKTSASDLSSAAAISSAAPYVVTGMAAQSNGQHLAVHWLLR